MKNIISFCIGAFLLQSCLTIKLCDSDLMNAKPLYLNPIDSVIITKNGTSYFISTKQKRYIKIHKDYLIKYNSLKDLNNVFVDYCDYCGMSDFHIRENENGQKEEEFINAEKTFQICYATRFPNRSNRFHQLLPVRNLKIKNRLPNIKSNNISDTFHVYQHPFIISNDRRANKESQVNQILEFSKFKNGFYFNTPFWNSISKWRIFYGMGKLSYSTLIYYKKDSLSDKTKINQLFIIYPFEERRQLVFIPTLIVCVALDCTIVLPYNIFYAIRSLCTPPNW